MIREGSPVVTLEYLAAHRNLLAVSSFSDGKVSIVSDQTGLMPSQRKHRVAIFGIIQTISLSGHVGIEIQNAIMSEM